MKSLGNKENSTLAAVKNVVPGFQEDSAFAKCCPNLTFKQVTRSIHYDMFDYDSCIRESSVSAAVLALDICCL